MIGRKIEGTKRPREDGGEHDSASCIQGGGKDTHRQRFANMVVQSLTRGCTVDGCGIWSSVMLPSDDLQVSPIPSLPTTIGEAAEAYRLCIGQPVGHGRLGQQDDLE